MKQLGQFLAGLTAFALLPALVENTAQHDALGPVIGLTLLLAIAAAGIFAWPVNTSRRNLIGLQRQQSTSRTP